MDPKFDVTLFATTLRFDIVPNVVEAYLRNDLEILENWSQERVSWNAAVLWLSVCYKNGRDPVPA